MTSAEPDSQMMCRRWRRCRRSVSACRQTSPRQLFRAKFRPIAPAEPHGLYCPRCVTAPAHGAASILLSYMALVRLDGGMKDPPKLRDLAQALEYWLLAALLLGTFVAGAISAIRWLLG